MSRYRIPFLMIPRIYTSWDYGRHKGLAIAWGYWVYHLKDEKVF